MSELLEPMMGRLAMSLLVRLCVYEPYTFLMLQSNCDWVWGWVSRGPCTRVHHLVGAV